MPSFCCYFLSLKLIDDDIDHDNDSNDDNEYHLGAVKYVFFHQVFLPGSAYQFSLFNNSARIDKHLLCTVAFLNIMLYYCRSMILFQVGTTDCLDMQNDGRNNFKPGSHYCHYSGGNQASHFILFICFILANQF